MRSIRIGPWVSLVRPANAGVAGISVLVGAAVSGLGSWAALAAVTAAGILTAAAGYARNDAEDLEADRVNRPSRPVASGLVSPVGARRMSAVLFGVGALSSLGGGIAATAIVLLWIALLVLYCTRLKRTGLPGHLLVSLVASSAFLLGGVTGREPGASLVPVGLAFFFHLGREILKDAQDEPGDRAAGVRSLAVRYGETATLRASAGALALLIVATVVPFAAGLYGRLYLAAVILGVDLPVAYVIARLLSTPSRGELARLSTLLKADMLVGIACILVGSGVV
jgi:geranylgeranylglycerol-phosphate geranylgeranyltransferase